MRWAIFTSGKEDWNVGDLKKEAGRQGVDCKVFSLTELVGRLGKEPKVSCGGQDLERFDALLVRWTPGGSAEQIVFRMDVLHRLENLGIKVFNPVDAIERCADKFYTCSLLEDAGIPVPKTVVAEKQKDASKAFEELGDVVVKPLFGSLGTGMLRVKEEDLAYRVFSALEFGRYIYYIQEFIPHENRDIRSFVLDGDIIGTMERISDNWKTNIAKGGKGQKCNLSEELKDVSKKSLDILGCEYAGVDIVETEDEFYVVEVNGIPGWKKLQSVTDINIAEKIVNYLKNSLY